MITFLDTDKKRIVDLVMYGVELAKIIGDKDKASEILAVIPEDETVRDAVKGALMRGLDTEYVISILTRHKKD